MITRSTCYCSGNYGKQERKADTSCNHKCVDHASTQYCESSNPNEEERYDFDRYGDGDAVCKQTFCYSLVYYLSEKKDLLVNIQTSFAGIYAVVQPQPITACTNWVIPRATYRVRISYLNVDFRDSFSVTRKYNSYNLPSQ